MKSITFVAAIAAVVTSAFGLTVNTPANVVECQPTLISWSGGTGPYYPSLLPAGQTTATPIETFPTQNGNSYTWNTNLATGTSFTISLKDSTGAVAYSDIVTVQGGSDSSCLNSSNSASGGGASAASTGGSSAASTAAAGTTAAGTTAAGTTAAGASASSKSAASATSSSSTATQSSSAGRLGVSSAFGVAGVMGLVGAALL